MEENNPYYFLKDQNSQLYMQLTESWKYYKTDFVSANDRLRTGIQQLAETVDEKAKKMIMKDKIELLMKRRILPFDKDYKILIERRNEFEYQKIDVKITDLKRYEKVMNILYNALYKYYEKKQPNHSLNYNYFPINDYKILSYQEKEFLGRKQKEYLAIQKKGYGIPEKYIIRQYSKQNELLFFTHEDTVLAALQKNEVEKSKNLMQIVRIQTKESNPYCYIGYSIDGMKKLSEIDLKTWNTKQKIQLIKDLVNGVYELGELSQYQINHRNINPENIYVKQNKSQLIAKLGNFELSKITMNQKEYESAYRYIKREYQKGRDFCCYYPKTGWEKSRTYQDWEKVDVYSLGKIVEYICFHKVIPNSYSIENFQKHKYPIKLGEIYSKMVNPIADRRPTIKQLKKEMKKVKGGSLIWRKRI